MREVAQPLLDLVEQRARALEFLGAFGRKLPGDVGEREMDGGEKLRGLVVQRERDPFGLTFEHVIQSMQDDIGFPESPVRHFKRRQRLHKESFQPVEQPRFGVVGEPAVEGGHDRL